MMTEDSDEDRTPRIHEITAQAEARTSAHVTASVRRGEKAWSYFYTLLGFALTIETGLVALIAPIKWPWNVVVLVMVGSLTVYLFLNNGWFQNKLLGIKARYENRFR